MKLLSLLFFTVLLTTSCTQNASKENAIKDTSVYSHNSEEKVNDQEKNDIAKEVILIEEEWAKVIGNHNWSVLDSILAPDFIGVGMENGVITSLNKAEMIAGYKSVQNGITSGVNSEVKAHVYTKNTAIVRGYVTEKGKYINGKDLYRKWYWTDTYVKRNGAWQCVANYSARLK